MGHLYSKYIASVTAICGYADHRMERDGEMSVQGIPSMEQINQWHLRDLQFPYVICTKLLINGHNLIMKTEQD